MKALILVVGLGAGFGAGTYFGVHHPALASNFAQQESQWVLKGKQEATKEFSARIDKALNNSSASATPSGVSNFLGGGSGHADTTGALKDLRDQAKSDLSDLQKQIDSATH